MHAVLRRDCDMTEYALQHDLVQALDDLQRLEKMLVEQRTPSKEIQEEAVPLM